VNQALFLFGSSRIRVESTAWESAWTLPCGSKDRPMSLRSGEGDAVIGSPGICTHYTTGGHQ
jgi:hypothetical protein